MKKNSKMLLSLTLSAFVAGLLAMSGLPIKALASGSSPSVNATVVGRKNNSGSVGAPLTSAAKGAKVFGVDTAVTLVTDEGGVAPTDGGLAALEIAASGGGIGAALPVCYLLVYDSSVAADTTESGSVSRLLVPPLPAALSQLARVEFTYPKQFHRGLVVLMGGAGAASCRGSVGWLSNGGAD